MIIKKDELLKALNEVKVVTRNKEFDKSNTVTFTKTSIITYTDTMAIICPFITDFSFSVAYDEFHDIILGINSENINIGRKENKLVIKARNTKSELTCYESTDIEGYIESLNLKEVNKKYKKVPEEFMEGVKLCSFSISKGNTQPFLNSLYIDDSRLVSCDDLRIGLYKMKEGLGSSFLISLAAVKELLRFEVTEYYLGKSWVYFSTDGHVVFCSRIVEDEFPEIEDNLKFKGSKIVLPNEIEKSIRLVSSLAEGDFDLDKRIEVNISGKKIKFKGEKEIGWVEDSITFDSGIDKEINFSINPYLFLDILKITKNLKIGEDRALFTVGNFRHLTALFNE